MVKILFVEPPKDYWFVMGEYLPPPYGILQLAAYLEKKFRDIEIKVFDCNAEGLDWKGLQKRMESFNPDIVASSALATASMFVAFESSTKRTSLMVATYSSRWESPLKSLRADCTPLKVPPTAKAASDAAATFSILCRPGRLIRERSRDLLGFSFV